MKKTIILLLFIILISNFNIVSEKKTINENSYEGTWSCIDNIHNQRQYLVINNIKGKFIIFFIDLVSSKSNRTLIGAYNKKDKSIIFKDNKGNKGEILFVESSEYKETIDYVIDLDIDQFIISFIRISEKDLKILKK